MNYFFDWFTATKEETPPPDEPVSSIEIDESVEKQDEDMKKKVLEDDPTRLEISSLRNIYDDFFSQWLNDWTVDTVFFTHGNQKTQFKANIKHKTIIENGKKITVSGITLPLDRFYFSLDYLDRPNGLKKTLDTTLFVNRVVESMYPISETVSRTESFYFRDQQIILIRIWNLIRNARTDVVFKHQKEIFHF